MGYLEEYNEPNKKSENGTLTPLEYMLAAKIDLADLHQFEQAREHSVELLEKWLSTFKFKNGNKTESRGKKVNQKMKQERARRMALQLHETKRWQAHSRGISIKNLQEELNLKLENTDEDKYSELLNQVRQTHSFIVDFMETTESFTCLRAAVYQQSESTNETISQKNQAS